MEEIKISNRQIALMAFDRLRKEDKTDSALKLARCMLHGTSISLGIGDIDWEIDRAIQQCGGVPRTGYRYTAYFHFNRNTEMAKEIYDNNRRNKAGRKPQPRHQDLMLNGTKHLQTSIISPLLDN